MWRFKCIIACNSVAMLRLSPNPISCMGLCVGSNTSLSTRIWSLSEPRVWKKVQKENAILSLSVHIAVLLPFFHYVGMMLVLLIER